MVRPVGYAVPVDIRGEFSDLLADIEAEMQSVLAELKYPGAVVMISGMPQQDLDAAARVGRMRGVNVIGAVRKPIAHEDIHAMLTKAKA